MTTIKGILGNLSCSVDGRKKKFELALGEDGEVYPISPGLEDMVDEYKAARILGFDPFEIIEGNDCLIRYLRMAGNPNIIICQSKTLPPFVMGRIVWEWLKNPPFCSDPWKFTRTPEACRSIQEMRHFIREYFQGGPAFPKSLFRKAKKVALELQGKKKFAKNIGRSGVFWLQAFEKLTDIEIAIEKDRPKHIGHMALKASYMMEMSWAKNPIYLGYERETKRAARESQVKAALEIIDDFDTWDVEIDVN